MPPPEPLFATTRATTRIVLAEYIDVLTEYIDVLTEYIVVLRSA